MELEVGLRNAPTFLATHNAHERDEHISFDAIPHTYEVRGDGGYTSVSTVVHEYFPVFDARATASGMVSHKDFPQASRYRQYRALVASCASSSDLIEEIVAKWAAYGNEQAALGTAMHEYIERFYNAEAEAAYKAQLVERYFTTPPVHLGREYQYAHQYAKDKKAQGYAPYRTEWRLYDERARVCGTIDMIFYKPRTGTYHMVDWKRCKKLSRYGFRQRGFGACAQMPHCNMSHYSLQLNLYTYLLEQHYGLTISTMHLAVFHPDNTSYLEVEVPRLDHITRTIMCSRASPL